jgi:hypothetical protein
VPPVGRGDPVVEQTVGLVPEPLGVDRIADRGEVLEELLHQVISRSLSRAAQDHRDELMENWDRCRLHQMPMKIEPLA